MAGSATKWTKGVRLRCNCAYRIVRIQCFYIGTSFYLYGLSRAANGRPFADGGDEVSVIVPSLAAPDSGEYQSASRQIAVLNARFIDAFRGV